MAASSETLSRVMGDPEYVRAIEHAAAAFSKYRSLLPLIPYAYTRTRLFGCARYEVVAMQWASGSQSPLHDHGTSRCWVLMLEGALAVENFERVDDGGSDAICEIRPAERITLRRGDVDHRYGPRELHRVRNLGPDTAFSLQVYAEPIGVYTVIDEHTRRSRLVTATCDLELDLDQLLR